MSLLLEEFCDFVTAREAMRVRRAEGLPREAWTADPILRDHRFCNVHREHDAVTKYVRRTVLSRTVHHAVVQFLACRIHNEPRVLDKLLPFDTNAPAAEAKRFADTEKELRAQGLKMLRGAYLVVPHGTGGKGRTPTTYYAAVYREMARRDPAPLEAATTLAEVAAWMMAQVGVGAFFANQVCTDLRYHAPLTPLRRFTDWETFVLAGPGTSRGLNRYHGRPVFTAAPLARKTEELLAVREEVRPFLPAAINEYFRDINDLSNCFCEFDKYRRAQDQLLVGKRCSLRRYNS